jgi:hypothetical protein
VSIGARTAVRSVETTAKTGVTTVATGRERGAIHRTVVT